jgi:hypothetical protein
MRNFWDEDPCGDTLILWLCALGFIATCVYSVLS